MLLLARPTSTPFVPAATDLIPLNMRPPVDKLDVPCNFDNSRRAYLWGACLLYTRVNKTYPETNAREASIASKCCMRYNCARSMAASSGTLLDPSPGLGARAVPVSSSLAILPPPPTAYVMSWRSPYDQIPPHTPAVCDCPWAGGPASGNTERAHVLEEESRNRQRNDSWALRSSFYLPKASRDRDSISFGFG